MFIGIYSRSQVSVYRTIGSLVSTMLLEQAETMLVLHVMWLSYFVQDIGASKTTGIVLFVFLFKLINPHHGNTKEIIIIIIIIIKQGQKLQSSL